jgi:hypothetical protein
LIFSSSPSIDGANHLVRKKKMSFFTSLLTAALALSGAVSGTPMKKRSPKIIFDGRVPVKTRLADLDSASASPFNAEYVLGAGMI